MKVLLPKNHILVYRGERIRDPKKERMFRVPDSHWHKLPVPSRDGIDLYDTDNWPNWWCGCTRKTDIFKWWKKKDLPTLPKGFRVNLLAVPKDRVVKGYNQCVFDRTKAKVVGYLNSEGEVCLLNKS
jgi:hypothetical protein